jgi:hypothetical protein
MRLLLIYINVCAFQIGQFYNPRLGGFVMTRSASGPRPFGRGSFLFIIAKLPELVGKA